MPIPVHIAAAFPALVHADCAQTSNATRRYNCIAYAAGVTTRWWWYTGQPFAYWPPGISNDGTLGAFEAAFATLGYEVCSTDAFEPDIEKIAIFVHPNGMPTHAARQLADGTWTSKLGPWEDIRHVLRQLEGTQYGIVAQIMSRVRGP